MDQLAHHKYSRTLTIQQLHELGRLLPTDIYDPAYREKINRAATYLNANYPVEQWYGTLRLVPEQYVPPEYGGAIQDDVVLRAAEITDDDRRKWRIVGVAGIGLTVMSLAATLWATQRACPAGG